MALDYLGTEVFIDHARHLESSRHFILEINSYTTEYLLTRKWFHITSSKLAQHFQ